MLGYTDPHQMLVNMHDTLIGWQHIRERRRTHHPPPTATATPPVSMYTAPVSGAPHAAAPAGPEASPRREPKAATVIAFHKMGDRLIPIFGDPAEVADTASRASSHGAPEPTEARAPQAPKPSAPPPHEPQAEPKTPQSSPPPPDFTPHTVEASAPRRTPAAPPTLDLPPPTPPSLVRTEEAITLERVLGEHRTQLAQHAAMMEAILAEHRRAQAQADQEHRQELDERTRAQAEANQEHRQQIAELLANHRSELQASAASSREQVQAIAALREILAQQAESMKVEHARVSDKIESIVDIVSIVGETVHHIAAAVLQPRMPRFTAPPSRPVDVGPSANPAALQVSPPMASTSAPRILPARPVTLAPSPAVATAVLTPHVADKAKQDEQPPTPATVSSHHSKEAAAVQTAEQGMSAAPAATRGELNPDPEPPPQPKTPPRAATTTTPAVAAACASASSRSPRFTPASATVLTLISREPTASLTPRQRRAEEEARELSRLHDAVSDIPDDDPMFDEPSDDVEQEGEVSRD